MATFTMQNGRAKRKQLSDELDRLDRVIDCLAENLTAAVADAVKDGARAAVREALTEILNHPAAATLLRPAPPEPPARPRMWSRVRAAASAVIAVTRRKAVAAIGKVKTVAGASVAAVRTRAVAARAKVRAVRRVLGASWEIKRALVIGLGVGVAVTGVSLLDHTVASVLSGAGAAVTAVAVQVGVWWRKVVRDWAAA